MKKIVLIILGVVGIILGFQSHDNYINHDMSLNFDPAAADCGILQFCSKGSQPYWGICEYIGNCQYDCKKIAHDCTHCDCDGTFTQE